MKSPAIKVAVIAVFAAMQALLSYLPFTITIGMSGQITLGVVGGPLIGILLGPSIGGSAVLIGSLIGVFLNPGGALFGPFTVIPPTLGAFSAGCVRIKRGYVAGLAILTSLLVFYAHPSGREAFAYTWLHIVALVLAFTPLALLAGSTFESSKKERTVFGISMAAFIGVLTDHIVGSAVAIWYFSPVLTPGIWFAAMPIYPIERLVAFTLATIITIPVYYGLRRAGFIELLK